MDSGWLAFAKGPLFRFSLAIMILGLGRIFFICLVGMIQAYRRSGNKNLGFGRLAKKTVSGLIPFYGSSPYGVFFSTASYLFHVGLVIVPLFFQGHIQLWKKSIGISWPSLPPSWADTLSFLVIATGLGLLGGRLFYPPLRSISRLQDYFLLFLISFSFISGLLAAHPSWHPFPYQACVTVHVLSGDVLLILIPFSKLAHVTLWPLRCLATELAWHFPSQAGAKILATLGKEDKI